MTLAWLDRTAIRVGSRLVAIGSWLVIGRYWVLIDRVTGRTWEDDS